MRTKRKIRNKAERRKLSVRAKINKITDRPRLCVFRSNNYVYAQIIDSKTGSTITGISSKIIEKTPDEKGYLGVCFRTGKALAEKAKEKNIDKVVFDRGSLKYHGRIKALADGARDGGLIF
ncbi:MAG: 50S ribosomal protein L18 [Actinobacteria bacterium]|nr:50S ribosomal protein L18 [Actinomycetota bacterium]